MINGLDAVSHGEFVDDFLSRILEINLPGVVAFGLRQIHHASVLLAQVVKQILVQTRVLYVIGSDLKKMTKFPPNGVSKLAS